MTLFPHWICNGIKLLSEKSSGSALEQYYRGNRELADAKLELVTTAGPYTFIGDPPRYAKSLDIIRLGVQYVCVILTTGVLFVFLKE